MSSETHTYIEYAERFGPRGWLDDATSRAWKGGIGAMVRAEIGFYKDSVKARFARTAPEDALPWIGDARQLERAPEEGVADYRARLQRSFEIHEDRTTKDGYRHALEPLGVDPGDVYVWNHYEAGVGNWWSLVYVMVDTRNGPWGAAPTCDNSELCDSGIVCDISRVTWQEISFARRLIRRYKWAGAYPVAIWVIISGQCCDMGLLCDSGLTCDNGTNDTAIIPLGKVTEQENLYWNCGPAKCDSGLTCDNVFYE